MSDQRRRKVYVVCSVRGAGESEVKKVEEYVAKLEGEGHLVHYPPRDVDQDCDTGVSIVDAHVEAMRCCDEVHVMWNADSSGSHFDIGMAIALKKPIVAVKNMKKDTAGKSYWKVLKEYERRTRIPVTIDSERDLVAHLDQMIEMERMSRQMNSGKHRLLDDLCYKFRYQKGPTLEKYNNKNIFHRGYIFRYSGGDNPSFQMKESDAVALEVVP